MSEIDELYRNGLIDSRHRDSLASYQIWGLGDERWEDVGAALGCGDGAGGVSGRAGGGSSCASAGDLAAAVGGGGLGGGAGDGVQPALGRQAGGAVERRGAGWAGRSAAQQWRRPGAGCGGSGRSGGGAGARVRGRRAVERPQGGGVDVGLSGAADRSQAGAGLSPPARVQPANAAPASRQGGRA